MSNIDLLSQYNNKQRELKRVTSRLNEIRIRLKNDWDKVKAATITDMPTHHDTEHGDKVGDIVASREELEEEEVFLEIQQSELNSYVINIDSMLDCLEFTHRYLLTKIYKDGLIGKRHREKLYQMFVEDVKPISWKRMSELIICANKEFNELR